MPIIIALFFIVLLGIVVGWFLWKARKESDSLLGTLRQLLKPNWQKLAVFALFLFIAYAGNTEAWVFSGKELGEPPPPLYDLLGPYLRFFWMTLVILLIPLFMLSNLMVAVVGHSADFLRQGPFWLVVIIYLAYFYILACLIVFVGGKVLRSVFKSNRS